MESNCLNFTHDDGEYFELFVNLFFLQHSFESLFRSMHFALLDNSCREYLFLADFFMVQKNSARDLFTAVFGKTLPLFLVSYVKELSLFQRDLLGEIK